MVDNAGGFEGRFGVGTVVSPRSISSSRRLRNIHENPRVALLCDHYDDDWTQLWWVRADGAALIADDGPARAAAVEMLVNKYEQYADDVPSGPVIVVDIDSWSGWAYSSA